MYVLLTKCFISYKLFYIILCFYANALAEDILHCTKVMLLFFFSPLVGWNYYFNMHKAAVVDAKKMLDICLSLAFMALY